MKVENISFSAHADAKGIINLIRHVNAENIIFVHGDKQKMQVFQEVVKQQLGKPVFRPANKQSIAVKCTVRKTISTKDSGSIPKQPAMTGFLLHKNSSKPNSFYKFISEQNLLKQLNMMRDIMDCCNSTLVEQEISTTLVVKNSDTIQKIQQSANK